MDDNMMSEVYSLIDEDGNEQLFELLDRMEVENQTYFAFTPYFENEEDDSDEDAELVVLKSKTDEIDESEGEMMVAIEDDEEYEYIGNLFLERIQKSMPEWFEEGEEE